MSGSGRVMLRGVGKRFGTVTALEAIDLAVEPGEFVLGREWEEVGH